MQSRRIIALLVAAVSLAFVAQIVGSSPASAEESAIVAVLWSGREVVFHLRLDELARRGLTVDDLGEIYRRRFSEGEYVIEAGGKSLDLAQVARIEVRELVAEPFVVTREDGLRVRVTPDPERVMRYMVTGGYFENVASARVRWSEGNPAATIVLQRLAVPGGHIPNMFTSEHVHYSLGEPLDTFARVEVLVPAGQKPPGYCATTGITGQDRWLPVSSTREVRVLVSFLKHVGGLNPPDRTLPIFSVAPDPRFSYQVTIDEILQGDPAPFELGAEVVFQFHSPSRDLAMSDPVGEQLVLLLKESVRAGGDRDYILIRAKRP